MMGVYFVITIPQMVYLIFNAYNLNKLRFYLCFRVTSKKLANMRLNKASLRNTE